MVFFTLIIVLFVSLLLISILNTLIFIALKLVTRIHFKESYLILPSLISLIIWFISYTILNNIISSIIGKNILSSIYAIILNNSNLSQHIPILIFFTVLTLVITLLLQSLSLLTVNINYTKIFNSFNYYIKTKFKKLKSKLSNNGEEVISNDINKALGQTTEKYKLGFINSFVCNLFIFSLLFFLFILFFWVGTLIGNSFI